MAVAIVRYIVPREKKGFDRQSIMKSRMRHSEAKYFSRSDA
jgi:hypothetical protein